MKTNRRNARVATAVLACSLAALVARSGFADGESKAPPLAPKSYRAQAVLLLPGVTAPDKEKEAFISRVVYSVLASSATYTTGKAEVGLAMASRAWAAVDQNGSDYLVTIGSDSPNSSEALGVAMRGAEKVRNALQVLIAPNSSENQEDPAEIEHEIAQCEKRLLDLLAPFGSYSDSGEAFRDTKKAKEKLDDELQRSADDIRAAEMQLAVDKAVADSIEQRLAKEAAAARQAEKDDPISQELRTLVDIAERECEKVANGHEGAPPPAMSVDQAKKAVAEARLALLRRQEELSNATRGPEFIRLKEELIEREERVVTIEAGLDGKRKREADIRAEIAKYAPALGKAQPLMIELNDLGNKLQQRKQELRRKPQVRVLVQPSLVDEDVSSGG